MKLAIWCAGSGPPGKFFVASQCRYYLCLPLENLSKATSHTQILAAFARLGCAQEGQSCAPRQTFRSTGSRDVSANVLRHTGIHFCLPLPAGLLPSLVTERLNFWKMLWWNRQGEASVRGSCCLNFRKKMVGMFSLPPTHTSVLGFSLTIHSITP